MSRVLPIIFNTEMVRAILEGRKTVTRRLIKPQPKCSLCYAVVGYNCAKWSYPDKDAWKYWGEKYRLPNCITETDKKVFWTPPCHIGDILYVREAYCPNYFNEIIAGYRSNGMRGNRNAYKADYHAEAIGDIVPEPKWKPSIHMPKEAARIWLKVKYVRVERLQDITEEQAREEGAKRFSELINTSENDKALRNSTIKNSALERYGVEISSVVWDFINIWNSTVKKSEVDHYGWNANPYVWVIEFERCEKPEREVIE